MLIECVQMPILYLSVVAIDDLRDRLKSVFQTASVYICLY
ncbi:hypothetical protein HMPREF9123_0725 [Neisseria bacilliformis ATCC BAA-1200]|uniref:Uncharacterized protein n=1 Tax=Neisseria bacilliformis ATCC BAA-1200 TaxID=888742 RepID=F2BAC1_9NEIS|nr:hypothetical protein HMPREF9123_0725 [Neisseria bacilliformis ATCC BAA-1200]